VAWIHLSVLQNDVMAQQVRTLQFFEPQFTVILPLLAEEYQQVDSNVASRGIGEPPS
jgi:hypothetical protein